VGQVGHLERVAFEVALLHVADDAHDLGADQGVELPLRQ